MRLIRRRLIRWSAVIAVSAAMCFSLGGQVLAGTDKTDRLVVVADGGPRDKHEDADDARGHDRDRENADSSREPDDGGVCPP